MPAAAAILQQLATNCITCCAFVIPALSHRRGYQGPCQGHLACCLQHMKDCHYLHPQAFDPARAVNRLLLESGAPIEAAVQAQAKHTEKKPSRLKGPWKELAQTSLSEDT